VLAKLTELGNAADFPDELEGIESMPRELSAPELTEKAELEDKKKA
jgi:hypothetical protein